MSARKKTPRRVAPSAAAAAPRFTLSSGWAAALLALLTVVFFQALVFGGRTFVSPDATAPLGFVRVGEQSLYGEHVYPLWNPYVFLGMPSFASLAYNPLIYPPDWPVAVLQRILPLPDMTWLLLYYFLAGFFTFALAREWGARPEGALLAACVFAFAPNLVAVGSHGHGSQLVDSAYLPLMLWLAARFFRRGGVEHVGLLGLAGGFQLLRGHFQIVYYTWLALGGYALVETLLALREPGRARGTWLRGLGVLAGLALALALAGFLFLPLREYNHYSIRGGGVGGGVGMEYATSWSLAPREIFAFLVPNAVGFGGPTYWGGMPFTDYPHYLGAVTWAVAAFAFLANGAPRIFALALALFALLVGLGKNFPLYQVLYDHLPYFKSFRVPVMILLLFQLAAALGAAWGWTRILDTKAERGRSEDRWLAGLAAAFSLMGLLGLLGRGALHDGYVAAALKARPELPEPNVEFAFQAMAGDLVRGALLGLLTLGAAWAVRRRKFSALLGSAAVLSLLLVDLWPVSQRVMEPTLGPFVRRDAESDRDDVIRFLEARRDSEGFRVAHLPLQVADPEGNRYAGFRIASLTGYHAAKPKLFQDAFDAHLFENIGYLSLLNVRYFITDQPFPEVPPFLRLAYQGSQTIYENLLGLPRATLVYRARVVADPRALLDSLRQGRDFAHEALLSQEPGPTVGPPSAGAVRISSYRLHEVVLDVSTPTPGLVRLADLYHPSWRADLDGRPVPVLRSDYLLRAVAVPAGRHRVRFDYEDVTLRRGLGLSAAALLISLGLVVVGLMRRRKAS